jgi:hypothetical protein
LNPDRRGGKPATNRFSYGATQQYSLDRYVLLDRSVFAIVRVKHAHVF